MDCVNHSGTPATAYCQHCGKALCSACTRTAPGGQIFCEPCFTAWQGVPQPFAMPPMGAPNPGLAAVLGFIPGVGAMYNGQFIKGLVHVLIFAVLVSASHVYGLFGLFIAGWEFYMVFEAYHTAKARRDGEPLPDPLGLNEAGNWFGMGGHTRPGAPPPGTGPVAPGAYTSANTPSGTWQAPYQAPAQPGSSPQADWQPPYQGPGSYQSGPYQPGPMPPPAMPPMPPAYWRRREPVGAVILIALGVLFLLDRFDIFSGRIFEFSWPLILIGLGVWLMIRRLGDAQGGPK